MSALTNTLVGPSSSKVSRVVGIMAIIATVFMLLLALVWSPPEIDQADAVRLFYVHVPSAVIALYVAFTITLIGSIQYLRKRSVFWDLLAHASTEIGVLFCALVLVTGMLWGKPTWGVYWQWDPRLTSTTVTFVLYTGYLAIRRMDLDPAVRSKRAAILGIVSFANLIIVRYSVEWWRSIHQSATFGLDTQLDDLMLFTVFWAVVTFLLIFTWLLIHRFRLAWFEHQASTSSLDDAIAARRAERSHPPLAGESV
ncbi:MAG: cytochrome c biogenesis protein CcsA [Acidimicrobiales bacterium]|nr:cytochrome c biogenesis protein CcsA [Acidimicrobiales bacterium]